MQINSKKLRLAFLILILLLSLTSCKDESDDDDNVNSTYSPPASHTKSKSGYMHHPSLENPVGACESCHGDDLKGGSAPSCYTCHGKKWD